MIERGDGISAFERIRRIASLTGARLASAILLAIRVAGFF